jgi:hypothetical protein
LLERSTYRRELTVMLPSMYRGSLLPIIYVIVGAFVAAAHHYYRHAGTVRGVGSALLAIFLWPLVLLGTDLHIH